MKLTMTSLTMSVSAAAVRVSMGDSAAVAAEHEKADHIDNQTSDSDIEEHVRIPDLLRLHHPLYRFREDAEAEGD